MTYWNAKPNTTARGSIDLTAPDQSTFSLSIGEARQLATELHAACDAIDRDDGIDECLRPLRARYWQHVKTAGEMIAEECIEAAIEANDRDPDDDLEVWAAVVCDDALELVHDKAFEAGDQDGWAIYTRQALLVRLFCSSDADASVEEYQECSDKPLKPSAYAAVALAYEFEAAAREAIEQWEPEALEAEVSP